MGIALLCTLCELWCGSRQYKDQENSFSSGLSTDEEDEGQAWADSTEYDPMNSGSQPETGVCCWCMLSIAVISCSDFQTYMQPTAGSWTWKLLDVNTLHDLIALNGLICLGNPVKPAARPKPNPNTLTG